MPSGVCSLLLRTVTILRADTPTIRRHVWPEMLLPNPSVAVIISTKLVYGQNECMHGLLCPFAGFLLCNLVKHACGASIQ